MPVCRAACAGGCAILGPIEPLGERGGVIRFKREPKPGLASLSRCWVQWNGGVTSGRGKPLFQGPVGDTRPSRSGGTKGGGGLILSCLPECVFRLPLLPVFRLVRMIADGLRYCLWSASFISWAGERPFDTNLGVRRDDDSMAFCMDGIGDVRGTKYMIF